MSGGGHHSGVEYPKRGATTPCDNDRTKPTLLGVLLEKRFGNLSDGAEKVKWRVIVYQDLVKNQFAECQDFVKRKVIRCVEK